MPNQTSFVEIIRDMVEEGHDLPAIVETLTTLGVKKANASMKTSKMLGAFKDNDKSRGEFISLINL